MTAIEQPRRGCGLEALDDPLDGSPPITKRIQALLGNKNGIR
jgi:hypothetical protein